MRLKPKKSLGQHFLIDQNILRKICAAAGEGAGALVEIGGGRGDLTRFLAQRAAGKLFVYEIDRRCEEPLRQVLRSFPGAQLCMQDFLGCDLASLARRFGKLTIVGNIPYFLSTPILEHLIKNGAYIDRAVLTVQKEFARRMCASAGSKEYGALSCYLQYHSACRMIFEIGRRCFRPVPKVDSALVEITMRRRFAHSREEEDALFRVIRAAFQHRRQMLRRSVRDIVGQERWEAFCEAFPRRANARPEELCLSEFCALCGIPRAASLTLS